MGSEDFAAQLAHAAALNQQIGRAKALLEIQEWAKTHRDALKHAGLYAALLRACGQ